MTASTKLAPPASFDRVARIYRWAEYLLLGQVLVRTREHFLSRVGGCRHALAIGDGDGRFLARLLALQPEIRATAVDTSAAMLRLLEQRCCRAVCCEALCGQSQRCQAQRCQAVAPAAIQRLRIVQSSALEILPDPGTDLIITHFFFDCLTQDEVEQLVHTLAAQAAPGTLWLLSDFGEPRPRMFRPAAALYIRSLYFAFRLLTGLRITRLPDPQTALRAAGFERVEHADRLLGWIYTELWRRK